MENKNDLMESRSTLVDGDTMTRTPTARSAKLHRTKSHRTKSHRTMAKRMTKFGPRCAVIFVPSNTPIFPEISGIIAITRSERMRACLLIVAAFIAACNNRTNFDCELDTNCNLSGGGMCIAAPTGNKWCAYPDPGCPGGYRYSDQDVGDELSGQCAGGELIDAGIDSPIDGPAGANFARSFGGSGLDSGRVVAASSNGIFVGGMMSGTIDLGAGARSGVGFLAKYDGSGQHMWSLGLPVIPRDLAVDSFGNVLIVGGFSVQMTFGGAMLIPQGGFDLYIAKFDGATGGHLLSRGYGVAGSEEGRRVAVLPNDDILVCGTYNAATNLGGSAVPHTGQNGSDDVFVAKMSRTNGMHIWSAGFGGTNNDTCGGLVSTASNNVVVLGSFFQTFTFFGATNAGVGMFDMYVAGFDANGVAQWHQRYGSTGPDLFANATLASQGDILAVGTFGDDFTMGPSQLNNSAGSDAVIARIAVSNGSVVWATAVSGALDEFAEGVSVVGDDVVIAGVLTGSATVGTFSLAAPASIPVDVYMAKLRYGDGVPTGARTLRGQSTESLGEIATMEDTVVLTGGFQGMPDFGVSILNNATGMDDVYLARVRP